MTELTIYRTKKITGRFSETDRKTGYGFLSLYIEDRLDGKLEVCLHADSDEAEETMRKIGATFPKEE